MVGGVHNHQANKPLCMRRRGEGGGGSGTAGSSWRVLTRVKFLPCQRSLGHPSGSGQMLMTARLFHNREREVEVVVGGGWGGRKDVNLVEPRAK